MSAETKTALATLAKMEITEMQQIGLKFNLGDLESLNLKPNGTCEAIFPRTVVVYTWDGTLIKCCGRDPNQKKA